MNQLTDEEINNIMFKYGLEMDDEHHAAMIREAIEAEHKRLLGVGMKPYGYEFSEATYLEGDVRGRGWKSQCFSHYNPSNERGMVADVVPLYSEDQLAAARLQDQQARHQAQIENESLKARIARADVEKAREVLPLKKRIAELEQQLAESGYSACDIATAAAQGLRDGMSQSK